MAAPSARREDLEAYLEKHGKKKRLTLAVGCREHPRSRCCCCLLALAHSRTCAALPVSLAADIRAMLKDCLNALLHELPEEPLPYIQRYFNSMGNPPRPSPSSLSVATSLPRARSVRETAESLLHYYTDAQPPHTISPSVLPALPFSHP